MSLAVIGGGSVATSFLYHVFQSIERTVANASINAQGLEVLVFEPREKVGRGDAYGDDLDSNLLNVTAGSMSVAGDDRLHFFRWLGEQGITHFNGNVIREGSFVSRPLFGRYLEDVFRNLIPKAVALGIKLTHVRSSVLDVESVQDGIVKLTTTGQTYLVQQLVMAMGNLPSTSFTQLGGVPGFFESPYPAARLAQDIAKDASVCVLGTSLSAVDAVVALVNGGHTGSIHCLSRNGRLPSVRGVRNSAVSVSRHLRDVLDDKLKAGSKISLVEMMRHLQDELVVHGVDVADLQRIAGTAGDALEFLDSEIEASSQRPRQWQAVGNALNGVIEKIWHLLGTEDRLTFERTIKPIWMARRVTFPMENAKTLVQLLKAGQLRISGGFRSLVHDSCDQQFCAEFAAAGRDGKADLLEQVRTDCVINATSFSSNAARSEIPLLRKLIKRGLACADPFGGFQLDFDSACLVGAGGVVNSRIGVLGTMATGTYFWTNAMDVNARLAKQQADICVALWTRSAQATSCAAAA